MEITDSHHHLWTAETHSHFLAAKDGVGPLNPILTYMLPDLLADIEPFNVKKTVHVQAFKDGYPPDESKWLQDIADSNPGGFPHGIVGFCDLSSPDTPKILSNHMKYKNMRGIRQLLTFHPDNKLFSFAAHDNFLTDPTWQQGFSLLATHNLSFDVHAIPHQYARVYEVIKSRPEIPVVVNHCGVMFERDEATMKLWREGLAKLSSCPNCFMKLSGLQIANKDWDNVFVKKTVQEIVALFGSDRCMFGSNFPMDKINASYKQVLEAMEFATAEYTAAERQNIFSNNANKFYRL